ncbi:two-component system catabolic regulation response regulator CreB [Chitinivorax tropicus]|uniref:Two-component system catabolic regulation response regulator CreB n=1 Tax=Chitinivorax tropicus TaxID=714531 RepID=A0A840MKG3_9PROT|nr:two-component system response regulator CreB [Chitinivorax tropicus]MBB5019674.1 two-component system catabolic regulation response regulator CreB [Chitinivorax tropicus]
MQRILLIEDEAAIADTIVYAMKRDGFECIWHPLGQSGMAHLAQHGADLVILDVGLPDGNGFEFCKQIRQHSNIPVLFLTARSDEIDRIIGLEIGADDYVVKPFSPRELVARVKAILKRTHPVVAPSKPNGFELHEAQARVLLHGHALDLTRYEYLLLKTLMLRPAVVFSRAQLMDQVWTQAENSLERTVDAHIKTLRAKIRLIDADCDPIETHRGMGYSFQWPKRV